jgi:TIR domain-containing protein
MHPAPARLEPRPTVTAVDDPASIFISYSHGDKDLALALYEGLKARGHRVWIDTHELRVGDSLIERISTAIQDIDFFLALVSPAAAKSSWCQKELALAVSGELRRTGMRVMPLRVDGADMPAALGDQLYLEVSLDDVDSAVDRLLRDIASYRAETAQAAVRQRSDEQQQVREHAARVAASEPEPEPFAFEPVRIVGVVEQGVGAPLNDGSRGSALYRVPLQLSRRPSEPWAELFRRNWDHPPSFTTMHRPGIGSVQGDTIVLDGTTMDELETVHLNTLRAVMDKTNDEAAEFERRQHEAQRREKEQQASHEENVLDVSRRLRFD